MLDTKIPLLTKAEILMEALPYIQTFSGKTVVIKYGGNAMTDTALVTTILQDITLLKYVGVNPVIVHGGGPEINRMLSLVGVQSQFHQGLRITDSATMEVVQMVLTGKINKDIVSQLNALGTRAIGLCGKDAHLLKCTKMSPVGGVDLGFVGEIQAVNDKLLSVLTQDEYIPVIAPIGTGEDGESYNINADTVAAAVAVALKAEKLMFLTDIDGVREDPKDPDTLLAELTPTRTRELIDQGIISGGMLPKVQACIDAVEMGVGSVHIVDGTVAHPLLLEMFTKRGIGTKFSNQEDEA